MGKSLIVLFLALLLVSAPAWADTFVPGTPGVSFAVNDGTNFVVSGSPIFVPNPGGVPGVVASAIVGGSFWQITNTASYSDAGIVLYFGGGLTLGALESVSVTTDNPSAMNVNLWFDTGGDGTFFSFTGDHLSSLAGDSYGGASGSAIDGSSSFYMFGGSGAGSVLTLAQLQAGLISGIGADTPVALWIGIVNADVATISRVDVTTVPEPASLTLLGTGLLGLGIRLKKRLRQ